MRENLRDSLSPKHSSGSVLHLALHVPLVLQLRFLLAHLPWFVVVGLSPSLEFMFVCLCVLMLVLEANIQLLETQ